MPEAPLQMMPKRMKPGEPMVKAGSGETEETGESTGAGLEREVPQLAAAQPEVPLSRTESGPGAASVGKKKKKSRVQAALNTLRAEGLDAFKAYIEAEIGEVALLHTLTERINCTENLGGKQELALKTIQARLIVLDPGTVQAEPLPAGPGPGEVTEKATAASVKASLGKREKDLFYCCLTGNAARFKHLFRHGNVDINVVSECGTFLGVAALKGHAGLVRQLFNMADIDVNRALLNGATPIWIAAQCGHVKIVELLLTAPGINVNLATQDGATPLFIAALSGFEDVVKLLLSAPYINVDARNDVGATPLVVAVQKNYSGIVRQLIKKGADVNLKIDEDDLAPLHIAAHNRNREVLRFLLQVPHIQVDCTTKYQLTPLSIASYHGFNDVAKLLLKRGADPNLRQRSGIAPLHLACMLAQTSIIKMLLESGADTEMDVEITAESGARGYTPYDLTVLMGGRQIMTLLEQYRQARPAPADKPGQATPPTASTEAVSLTAAKRAVQSEQAALTLHAAEEGRAEEIVESAERPPVMSLSVSPAQTVSDSSLASPAPPSPLVLAKDALVQEILRKLEYDILEPLEGIRLMVDVRATKSMEELCGIYNRLASIERQRERARRRGVWRRGLFMGMEPAPAQPAAAPVFSLGGRTGLDADAIEGEIKVYLGQEYHRFVSQAVNNMEFGRGKPTSGYSGLWHVSAGISGVGSCSVFYYGDEETQELRIVGVGHHVGRAAYRLVYAAEELGRVGHILRIT